MATPGFSAGIASGSDIHLKLFLPSSTCDFLAFSSPLPLEADLWTHSKAWTYSSNKELTSTARTDSKQYQCISIFPGKHVDDCRYNSRAFVSSFPFHPLFPSVPFPPTLPLLPLDLDSLVGRTKTDTGNCQVVFPQCCKTSNKNCENMSQQSLRFLQRKCWVKHTGKTEWREEPKGQALYWKKNCDHGCSCCNCWSLVDQPSRTIPYFLHAQRDKIGSCESMKNNQHGHSWPSLQDCRAKSILRLYFVGKTSSTGLGWPSPPTITSWGSGEL